MAYSDPQTVTVSGTGVTLPRTSSGTSSGEFTSADGVTKLAVSHQHGKRTRSTIRLSQSKIASDPLIPTQNARSSMTAYVVVDRPVNGYSVAEAKALVDALTAYLTASTGARVTQLLGGES